METFDGHKREAGPGDAVVLTTEDEIDISRGDMIVRPKNVPILGNRFEAYLCWMSDKPLDLEAGYVLLHTTREVRAFVDRLEYRVDVETMHREAVPTLGLNEIGRVEVTTSRPIFYDSYRLNPATGSFVLIDPHTNMTVAAGMVRGEVRRLDSKDVPQEAQLPHRPTSPNVTWEGWNIPRDEREARNGHPAMVLWFTGMSGAGKSTIARAVEHQLFQEGVQTMLLDGDQVRHGLSGDLGFSPKERTENIRRIGEVAKLFFEQGCVVLCAFVSPYQSDRDAVRGLFPGDRFAEVYVHAPLDVLKDRDPKGLYSKLAQGEIDSLSGLGSPYEPPISPEVDVDTVRQERGEAVAAILSWIRSAAGRGEREDSS